jgi:predicted ATPase
VVYWPLESVRTAEHAFEGLARAFSVELTSADCIEQLVTVVAHRRVLLVLDNAEYMLEQLDRTSLLLQKCPNLKILLTSRVRLNLDEEWVYEVEGFSVPEKTTRLEEAEHHDAVALFVGRARKVNPGFTLDEDSLPFEICERVAGLPLGIELAASWVKVLSPQEIAEGLEEANLTTSLSHAPERHRSLRHVFEGSWQLLSGEEQTVLAKLSVFQGGFSREAAREVAGATLLVLARLVDKSLLRVSAGSRYEFQPLLQHYLKEKLVATNDEAQATNAHAHHFLALAERVSVNSICSRQH